MWAILKVFTEFVTILLLFYVLVFWPGGMWDLSFLTRDQTHIPVLEGEDLPLECKGGLCNYHFIANIYDKISMCWACS